MRILLRNRNSAILFFNRKFVTGAEYIVLSTLYNYREMKRIGNKYQLLSLLLLTGMVFQSCKKADSPIENPAGFELKIPAGFPDMEFPADNQFTQARWELGKKLFFDPIMSRDNSISCGSCHKPALAFADDRSFSPGIENRPGTRNAPSLANIGYHPYFLREGSVPTLEMQVLVPVQEHNEFDHSMPEIAARLMQDPVYVKMSQEAYDRVPDPWVITRALGVFQRTLISGNSAYDRFYYQGDQTALTEQQERGMALFFSARTGCADCHGGFNFTNYAFENNGLDTFYTDPLRMRFTHDPADRGKAKVPSLRNVALTAPYMHDGRFQTLSEVVDHYNSGGKADPNRSTRINPLNLTISEREDLVAFLRSLTDTQFTADVRFK